MVDLMEPDLDSPQLARRCPIPQGSPWSISWSLISTSPSIRCSSSLRMSPWSISWSLISTGPAAPQPAERDHVSMVDLMEPDLDRSRTTVVILRHQRPLRERLPFAPPFPLEVAPLLPIALPSSLRFRSFSLVREHSPRFLHRQGARATETAV